VTSNRQAYGATHIVFPALLAAAFGGCGPGEARDAAVAESGSPTAWIVTDYAELRIGASEAEPLVAVTGAVSLPGGGIAIADAGTARLDVFDERGRRVRTMGREGRGPGEFSHPSWIGLRGDTLRVWDMVEARLTLFDMAGRFIQTEPPVTDLGSFPRAAGQFADGSLLILGTAGEAWRTGPFRDSLLLVRIHPADGSRDTLGRVPGDEQFGMRSADGRVTESTTLPFGRRTLVAAHGARAFVATGDTSAVLATADGRTWTTAARVPAARMRVTRQDIDDYWARLITLGARSGTGPPEGMEYPTEYPPYVDLLTAPSGDLWVSLPSRPTGWSEGSRWLVFASDGALRGSVFVPGRARVLEVGPRSILVVETDADDRQLVSRYGLTNPP